MRIALLGDVHGNSIALDAVLADLDRFEPDEVVFLGDAATNGFDPRGAVSRLRRLDGPGVMGNTDADVLDTPNWYFPPRRQSLSAAAQKILEISLWAHEQLDDRDRLFLTSLRPTVEVQLPAWGKLLCFHGSPRANTDVMTTETSGKELDQLLSGVTAQILAGGHTHVPLLRRHRNQTLLNPGSVGLPFQRYGLAGQVPLLPCAQYAVLQVSGGRFAVRFEAVAIDVATVVAAALDTDMPHARWWTGLWKDEA